MVSLTYSYRPICEPVELAPGAPVRAQRIRQDESTRASEPFVHFHGVHELVLFGEVGGDFRTEDCHYRLQPGAIAFVPSMREHDFTLAAGRRDWWLVQVEAGAGEMLASQPGMERLHEPFVAMPETALWRHLADLAGWLVGLEPTDPLMLSMAELLLRAATRASLVAGEPRTASAGGLRRLRPAIDELRRHPTTAPGAEKAAALCALSPAYFSRRFKQQVGMSWGDYVRTHRLHLACRRLLETDRAIADIAYDVGFSTPSHFGKLFRERFGISPSQYRTGKRAR